MAILGIASSAERQALEAAVPAACLVAACGPIGLTALTPAEQHDWGRRLAGQLSSCLLGAKVSLPPSDRGRPQWPSGVVGSISHVGRLVVACAAPAGELGAVGIDIVPVRPVSAAFARRATENVAAGSPVIGKDWAMQCLAMKEAAFKAMSSRAQEQQASFLSVAIHRVSQADFVFGQTAGGSGRGRVSRTDDYVFACAWRER